MTMKNKQNNYKKKFNNYNQDLNKLHISNNL